MGGQRPDRAPGGGSAVEGDADRISVELLGGLRVRAGGSTMGPRDLGGTKPRRILLALLLHRGAPVSKDRLVSLLWDADPPLGARATLESYVCLLRRRLQPEQLRAASPITTVAGGYAIDMARVDMDVAVYERLVSTALRPGTCPTEALPMLAEAMVLAESPLLPEEVDSEWLDEVRATHDHAVRRTLVAAANKVAALAPATAQRWARTALDADPLDESAWRALLQGMEASGQHADGLRTYDQCRRLFAA
jgi:DNA-binding SARP family transcriptional activator